jgi:hypothetical protein
MVVNTNVPWTPYYPYGPIWYLINFPVLLYGWTLPYQIEVFSMIIITIGVLGYYRHYRTGTFFSIISALFISSGQPYLISSLSLLALGIISPIFTFLSIMDRLPIGTSWDFTHSGNWLERTHIERYVLYGTWFIAECIYWSKNQLRYVWKEVLMM